MQGYDAWRTGVDDAMCDWEPSDHADIVASRYADMCADDGQDYDAAYAKAMDDIDEAYEALTESWKEWVDEAVCQELCERDYPERDE